MADDDATLIPIGALARLTGPYELNHAGRAGPAARPVALRYPPASTTW